MAKQRQRRRLKQLKNTVDTNFVPIDSFALGGFFGIIGFFVYSKYMPYKDIKKRNEYNKIYLREWRKNNRDKVRGYDQAREKHKVAARVSSIKYCEYLHQKQHHATA